MDITATAIKQNRMTLVLTMLLFGTGIAAFINLPKALDPGFTVRVAVITTQFPGASPERVELLITDKIEKEVQEMPEVDRIVSDSRNGLSLIYVYFKESETHMRPLFDQLRRKVENVEPLLPGGSGKPRVNDEFGDVFGSVYALTGDGYGYAELKRVADEIKDRLLKEPDVAKVTLHGVQEETVFVEYNNARMTELGLSPQQLAKSLSDLNVLASGGSIVSGPERITLEPTGNLESVEALARTVITLPNGAVVYLGDIANIYRGYEEPTDELARVNGGAAIVIALSLRDGGDILRLGEQLNKLVPDIEAQYPWGIKLDKIWFQAGLVAQNVSNFVTNLLQAVGIVVVVMLLFLGLRTGMVVATLIPTTMIITFMAMQSFGITINQVSLAALIIALGLLVDNAIVLVESVLVKRENGVAALEAALQSGKELRTPLLVSSLTTGAAFMPIALAESAVGEYSADIFYVVTLTLLISWLLAMTLIPWLTTIALKVKTKAADEELDGVIYRVYRVLIRAALRFKLLTMAITVAAFIGGTSLFGVVPQIFIAPSEDPVFTAQLELPLGTDIHATEAVVEGLDQYIKANHEGKTIDTWLAFIGKGGPRLALVVDPPKQNPAMAFLIVNTTSGPVTDAVIADLNRFLFEQFPDLTAKLNRFENGPPVGYPITVRISGASINKVLELGAEVTDKLYATAGVASVKNSWGMQTKKAIVQVDQERARRAGVSSDDVAYSLQTGLSGATMTEYREGDNVIPVKLRTVAAERNDIDTLYGLSVYGSSGGSVPLLQVADIDLTFETGLIERRNRLRTLSLKVQLEPGMTATEVNNELLPWLEQQQAQWSAGYKFEVGGESEEAAKANQSIADKLPLAVMVIVLLLVGQFNSVRRAVIVLGVIPLGLIGVGIGLVVAKSSMGFFTFLGIISLAGIIINNAIVLLDRIRIEREDNGKAHDVAVVDACIQRLRPILLTTATTVLGMLPLWWGGGPMFEPMAVAIIFGLAFATMLTLLVVPVMYAVLFGVRLESV